MSWAIIGLTGQILQVKFLLQVGIYAIILMSIFIILFTDYITQESVDPKKIFIIALISGALIILSFDPNAVQLYFSYFGDITIELSDFLNTFTSSLPLIAGFIYFYYITKIYLNSPKKMKKYSAIILLGAVMHTVLFPIFAIFYKNPIIFIIGFNLLTIGILISVIAFLIQPKLFFILAFKKLHHIYILMPNGISIFDYSFTLEKETSSQLIVGGLTGVFAFIQKVTQSDTKIKSVIQENVTILLEHGKYVIAALITEKNHIFLRNNLSKLIQDIENNFNHELEYFEGDVTPFPKIEDLVKNIFVY